MLTSLVNCNQSPKILLDISRGLSHDELCESELAVHGLFRWLVSRLFFSGDRPIRRQVSLSLALISIVVLFFSGLLLDHVLTKQAQYLIDERSRVLMGLILSVRDYTDKSIEPLIAPINERDARFNPVAVPSFAAQRVFDLFVKQNDLQHLSYNEPALNPTNPADRADAFEAQIIERFRAEPALSQISGDRWQRGQHTHYVARPLRVSSLDCLRCHSTPAQAPQSQIARYGSEGGFGWSLNEIVGAQVLSVSHQDILELKNQSLAVTALLLAGSLVFLILVVNMVIDRKILVPIIDIAQALRRLRLGSFDLRLSTARADEMGNLINDLDHTARQLGDLMESQKALTVKSLQLETARAIHRCFLVKQLPSGNGLLIAAHSTPALDVGADWYDSFVVGDITFVIVADVCDKGVGSALFMSVFRSLIHFNLESIDASSVSNVDVALIDTISRVNSYMAANHDDMMMFATVFVAAFHRPTNRLTYINAGHERPVIISPDGLSLLSVTGPAVGVFRASQFAADTISLPPGSILFAYTDGLSDARSPFGEAWGSSRLHACLLAHYSSDLSPHDLIHFVENEVSLHVAGADPFDDLTILSMKVEY